jgi:hypothetical protein
MQQQPAENAAADPPRPLHRHAAERVALGLQAAQMSEFAAALIPTATDDHAVTGEFITQARQVRKFAQQLVVYAVLLERARGATWAQIAAAMNADEAWVRSTYAPAEHEWTRARLSSSPAAPPQTAEDALRVHLHNVPTDDAGIRKAAEVLDTWCREHGNAHSLPPTSENSRPVTDGILEE